MASLAADAVATLRDYGKKNDNLLINENIIDIIPLYESRYYYGEEDMFEEPMKEAFREMLEYEPILLSRNDKYLMVEEAYTAIGAVLEQLTQEQFYFLRSHSRSRDEYDEDEISKDIDFIKWELIMKLNKIEDENGVYADIQEYTVEDFGNDISAEFMEKQKADWVSKFYTFLRNDAPKYWKMTPQTRTTAHVFRHAPIVKIQSGDWVAPFRETTTPNVFMPIENSTNTNSDYNFISKEYLKDEMARKFFNELEIKQPDEFDYICNVILKKYEEDEDDSVEIDNDKLKSDFHLLLSYYQRVKDTKDEDKYIALLKSKLYLVGTDNTLYKPSALYIKNDFL